MPAANLAQGVGAATITQSGDYLDGGAGVPLQYGTTTHYYTDLGLIGLPVGGPVGTPACVAQMYAPICFKVVTFSAEVLGDQPILPNPDTGSANDVLLFKRISGAMPNPLPDQSQSWTMKIQYIYLMLQPPSDSDRLGFGVNPYSYNVRNAPLDADTKLGAQLPPQAAWNPDVIPASPVAGSFAGYPFTSPLLAAILNQAAIGKPGV